MTSSASSSPGRQSIVRSVAGRMLHPGHAIRHLAALALRRTGPAGDWRLLRWLPLAIPGAEQLRERRRCLTEDYARWCEARDLKDVGQWLAQHRECRAWRPAPRFSIVTPVYDTDPAQLRQCIDSVRQQSYPYWQHCIADDASTDPATRQTLADAARTDPRIRVERLPRNQGICAASNAAIALARGDWVAFLDHDDMLAPDALYWLARAIRAAPDVGVLYSDRDMLSAAGPRGMHLLKPAWSPETLLAGNYLFHLTAYRRDLLARLGGLRADYEGSQDYDLALRASEAGARIGHVPRVLYHWREHAASIATNEAVKSYVYDAGKAALADALARRGLDCTVGDVPGFRGHYRAELPAPDPARIALLQPDAWPPADGYRAWLERALAVSDPAADLVVVLGPGVGAAGPDDVAELARWLGLPGLGLVTGRVVSRDGRLVHAGLVLGPRRTPQSLYHGASVDEPGYMAYAAVMRNVSAPHPWCLALRREAIAAANGLDQRFAGGHAIIDLALRTARLGWRTAYVPYATFVADDARFDRPWHGPDAEPFAGRWRDTLTAGDPCFPVGMRHDRPDMALDDGAGPPPLVR